MSDAIRECEGVWHPVPPCFSTFDLYGVRHRCKLAKADHVRDHKCECGAKWGHG